MNETQPTVWVCGKYKGAVDGISAWTFEGVFCNEERAIAACKTDKHFIGPAIMDETMSADETVIWPGCYYPNV